MFHITAPGFVLFVTQKPPKPLSQTEPPLPPLTQSQCWYGGRVVGNTQIHKSHLLAKLSQTPHTHEWCAADLCSCVCICILLHLFVTAACTFAC